jgi:hypothetical protein
MQGLPVQLISAFLPARTAFSQSAAVARRLYFLPAAGKDDPINGSQFEFDFLDILPHFAHSGLAKHAGHKSNRKLARENIMDGSFGFRYFGSRPFVDPSSINAA